MNTLSESGTAVALVCLMLIPLAIAGVALMNAGLGRSRSASHTLLASLCVSGVAAFVYFFWGFAAQGFPGGPAHILTLGGKDWSWLGASGLFFRGIRWDGSAASLVSWLGMFAGALVAVIPLGAASDRWRLGAACAAAAFLSGVVYPLFGHWAWGGGWLAQLGTNRELGRGFTDVGGSGAIHAVGGLAALSMAWILGPRRGKYSPDGVPAAIPGHNGPLVLFACVPALAGWVGLNGAGALLFGGASPGQIALVGVNTLLSGGMAALTAASITRVRFGRPDASLCANAWIGGLVASSAGCLHLVPASAALTGMVAGALVPLSVEWFDVYLGIDDPGGSISVHGVAGIWGLVSAGLLATGAADGQAVAQMIGIAVLLGLVFPLIYGFLWLLNRFYRQRVPPEGEWQGLDLYELGAGAYPEFVVRGEDFLQR